MNSQTPCSGSRMEARPNQSALIGQHAAQSRLGPISAVTAPAELRPTLAAGERARIVTLADPGTLVLRQQTVHAASGSGRPDPCLPSTLPSAITLFQIINGARREDERTSSAAARPGEPFPTARRSAADSGARR